MLRNPFDAVSDPARKKRLQLRVVVAGVTLGSVLLCSGLILGGLALSNAAEDPARATQQASFDSVKPLKELCAGGAGHAAAANYTPGNGPHRLVVFRSNIAGSTDLSTFYNRSEDYPAGWQATELAQAELVACVHTGSIVVEECVYTLKDGTRATLQRVQLTAIVQLYAAHTGELVGRGELPGSAPRACQDKEPFAEGVRTAAVTGEAVTADAIAEWLREYVQ
jgi:hypothetical protein